MRQGGDIGTQYRSAIYTYSDDQKRQAEASRDAYQLALKQAGKGTITTEIRTAPEFYYAEEYHQQYLAKNPGGYCGLGGTGVACPTGVGVKPSRSGQRAQDDNELASSISGLDHGHACVDHDPSRRCRLDAPRPPVDQVEQVARFALLEILCRAPPSSPASG